MIADWPRLWRVICSNMARGKTQIYSRKNSIHSFRLETGSVEGCTKRSDLLVA